MRAFILRRVELIANGLGDVVLVGSSHCAGTLRVREFLTRNGHPYASIDLDRDDGVQALLDRFNVQPEDVPVLICRGDTVLRNPTNRQIADCLGFNDAVDAAQGARRRHRRRRAVGAGGRGVRRVRGARHAGGRDQRAGRAGRRQLEDRELPGLPDRHLRPGTGRPGATPRRRSSARRSSSPRAPASSPARASRMRSASTTTSPVPARTVIHRHRRRLPPARSRQPGAVRGRRRLLRRHAHRGPVVPRRRGGGDRRRQLGRPGGGVPGAVGAPRLRAGARQGPGRHDVALPDPADRGQPGHLAPHRDRDRRLWKAVWSSNGCSGGTGRVAASRPRTCGTSSS